MRVLRYTALALMAALVVAACGTPTATRAPAATGTGAAPSRAPATATSGAASAEPTEAASEEPSTGASEEPSSEPSGAAGGDVDSAAADLRTALDIRLGEHLILAAKATGAALGGRTDEFDAYGTLLNTNGTELGAMIGSVYGADAEDEFNRIWSAHNGFFVDYTTGVATDDMAMQDQAVTDLTETYVPEFSAFLATATGLPEETLSMLITEHVLTTKAIVDAQASGDAEAAATADREAAMHMQMQGDPLASGIVGALPDEF